jgi:hypothetical protein
MRKEYARKGRIYKGIQKQKNKGNRTVVKVKGEGRRMGEGNASGMDK